MIYAIIVERKVTGQTIVLRGLDQNENDSWMRGDASIAMVLATRKLSVLSNQLDGEGVGAGAMIQVAVSGKSRNIEGEVEAGTADLDQDIVQIVIEEDTVRESTEGEEASVA